MPSQHQTPIPESLRKQLEEFRRKLWRIKITEAAVAGLLGLLVSFLLVYGLDRILPTPAVARLAILLAGTSLFALFAPYWLRRWVWGHRREDQIARLISRSHPGLGDRLLGVIELQDQQESVDSLSPRLRSAAMEVVAAEAATRQLSEALPPARHRRWSFALLLFICAAAAVFTLTPRAGLNSLKRWLLPLSDTPRYTFTRLDHPPETLVVPFGEAFDVQIHLAGDSENRPADGSARYGHQPEVGAQLTGHTYHFPFPGQQDPGVITFHIGDAIHQLAVTPCQRPAAESISALVTYPEYLKIQPKPFDLRTGVLSALQGSTVKISLNASRPLRSAQYGPTLPDTTPAPEAGAAPPPFEPASGPLAITANQAVTPALTIGAIPFQIPFSWTDQLGLDGEAGFRLRIDPLQDLPPTAYLQGSERQKAILPQETVDFEVLAEDDFGLKEAGIEWQGEATHPTPAAPAKGSMKLADGGPETRRLSSPAAFSPGALGITPQKITLRGYTEDYLPGRGRVYSEPVTLYVLTLEEHATLLKNEFDHTLGELEDLARRERNQFEENQRLERLEGAELQKDPTRERLKTQQDAENENSQRMDDLANQMEKLFKDATRNSQIDKETLKKMAEAQKSMKELGKTDMPKVEGKLADSQDQRDTPDQAQKDVQKAVEEQQKVLDKMQQAIDKANDANRRMEEGSFIARLKKAAGEENSIASSIIDGFIGKNSQGYSRTGGISLSDLDPTDLHHVDESYKQQTDTSSDLHWLQEDLGHFFTRTNKEIFKQILDEMQAARLDAELEDILSILKANHGAKAIASTQSWAKKLSEWAKKLEGDSQQGGGGGGGGQKPNPEDEDFEFNLRVMRVIQQELDLRSRTRALEQFKRSLAPDHAPAPVLPSTLVRPHPSAPEPPKPQNP